MSWSLALLSLLAGLASALLPFVNAEALAASASRAHRDLVPVLVVALAAGQTLGKLTLFELAGRGASRLGGRSRRHSGREGAISRIASRHATTLQTAGSKVSVVAVSALTGLPPLAAVAVVAGTAHTKRLGFVVACFTGRTVRFAVIAYGLTLIVVR